MVAMTISARPTAPRRPWRCAKCGAALGTKGRESGGPTELATDPAAATFERVIGGVLWFRCASCGEAMPWHCHGGRATRLPGWQKVV